MGDNTRKGGISPTSEDDLSLNYLGKGAQIEQDFSHPLSYANK